MLNSNFQQNTTAWSNINWTAKGNDVLEQATRTCSQHSQLYQYSTTKRKNKTSITASQQYTFLLPQYKEIIRRDLCFGCEGKSTWKSISKTLKVPQYRRVNDIPERYCIRSIDLSHCCQISFQLWVLVFSIIANLPEEKYSGSSYLFHYWHLI